MKKNKNNKKVVKTSRIQHLDCYGIEPKGKGKISFGDPYQDRQQIMKELGDLGKW